MISSVLRAGSEVESQQGQAGQASPHTMARRLRTAISWERRWGPARGGAGRRAGDAAAAAEGGKAGAEGLDAGSGPGHAAGGECCEAGAAEAASAAFRGALEKMAANGALAVSELYLGRWRERHWCGQQVPLAVAYSEPRSRGLRSVCNKVLVAYTWQWAISTC